MTPKPTHPTAAAALELLEEERVLRDQQLEKYDDVPNPPKLYCSKVEVSVGPNGIACSVSKHYPGSVSDITIMRDMMHVHDNPLETGELEKAITDIGIFQEHFSNQWAVLVDKGYYGIESDVRAIMPKKKHIRGVGSALERQENEAKSSDRVIVENVFGRHCLLWGIISFKYRWPEDSYNYIFRLTVALTNIHIKWHPLRREDGPTYERYIKRLHDVARTAVRKRRNAQSAYRRKRQRMMQRSAADGDDDFDDALFGYEEE